MGQELDCRLRIEKRTLTGRALLETDYVLFRGEQRVKVAFADLTAVHAAGGILRLEYPGGPAEFELGPAAEKWAHKILHPPSRLDKLGVKDGMALRLVGKFDEDFVDELPETTARGKRDLVFLAAQETADLQKMPKCLADLKPEGAIWVVYPKGVKPIREIDVLQAGRAAGLKDVKVAKFSETHTALKFVVPVTQRGKTAK